MAVTEELQVLITAQNAQLLTAIDEASRKLDGMAAAAKTSGDKSAASLDAVAKSAIKLGAAAVAAAGGALYLFKQIADGVDATNQLGKALGISYTEMARLNYAAQQAGVQQGALTASMRIMNRTFGEIATGGGKEAVVALQRLGLSVDQLQNMNAADKFTTISTALRGVDDAATRAAIAQELFGKGGQQILPLILDDVQNLSKEFDRLGTSLTAMDVQALDDAGDALDRLQTAASMSAQKFSAELAPAITAATDMVLEMITGNEDLGDSATTASDIMIFGMGKALDIMLALKGALDIGTGALMNLGAFGIDVFESLLWGIDMVYAPFKTMVNGWIQIHNLVFKDEQWALLGDLEKAVAATERFSSNLHDAGTVLAGKGFSEIGDALSGKASSAFYSRTNENRAKAGESSGGTGGDVETEIKQIQTDEQLKADAKLKAEAAAKAKAHEAASKQAEEWAEEQRISSLADEEAVLAKYKQEMEQLNEHHNNKLVSEETYSQTSLALQKKLDDDIGAIASKRASKDRADADAKLARQKAEFRDSISTAAQSNKTFFELHKAMKLAEAAINIPAAVSGAYAVGAKIGGPALGAAFGATAFAAQVVNMQAIASSSFGGSSAATSVGGSSSSPASSVPSAQPAQAAAAPRESRVTTVSLQGDSFSRDGVRGLLTMLAEELADGGVLRTT